VRYHKLGEDKLRRRTTVTDLLIRDVPDDVVAAIDANAGRLGLSRTEYLRRTLAQAAHIPAAVTIEQLRRFGSTFADLADDEIMRQAWA
jgi:hypothetical protein